MKKQNIVFSKKLMPPNAQRVTKAGGRRVWIINGKEFASKRDYFVWLSQRSQPEPEKPKTPETKVCECETPKPQELVPEWCETCGGKISSILDIDDLMEVGVNDGLLEDIIEE